MANIKLEKTIGKGIVGSLLLGLVFSAVNVTTNQQYPAIEYGSYLFPISMAALGTYMGLTTLMDNVRR